MKREGLATAVFVLSTCCHGLAFTWVVRNQTAVPFGLETALCIAAAYACSCAAYVSDNAKVFGPVHVAQGLLTLLSLEILAGRTELVEASLLVPFCIQTTTYIRVRDALLINGTFAAGTCAVDGLGLAPLGAAPFLLHLWPVLLLSASTTAAGCLITRYRETIVRHEARIAELDAAVSNLANANTAFQNYADTIESVSKDDERNRITRELHDIVGYALTNILMMMNAGKALARQNPDSLPELFENARLQADDALQESRRILYKLRSITSEPREGLHALEHLVRSFREATGVATEIHYGNLSWSYGESIDAALFRFIQEGLTNSFKHGRARRVRITLWHSTADIQARVWDDGTGSETIVDGIGLSGMKERFAALGGRVTASNVADGFLLEASIPIGEGFHDSGE
jgi:signal transduction histidine kinase